jgi:hypothetical protein
MNTATDNDWTTVRSGRTWNTPKTNSAFGSRGSDGARSMPAAFGAGGGSRRNDTPTDDAAAARREYHNRMNAEAEAAIAMKAARERREAEEKARVERENMAFGSESSYPSLGGAAAKSTTWPTMNYGRVVADRVARDKMEDEERALAAAASANSNFDWMPSGLSSAAAAQRRRCLIGTRCFDDGPEDYDGPDEDYGDNDIVSDHEGEEKEEEDSGEFNADLGVRRRRGDKNSLY